MREQTGWWLQTAQRDLDAARMLIEAGDNERTHSGLELLARLRRGGLDIPEEFFHRARKLDRSYIDSRYPNGIGGPPENFYDKPTAEKLFTWAQSVMDFVKSNLS